MANNYKNFTKLNILIIILLLFFICVLSSVSAADVVIDNTTGSAIKGSLGNGTIILKEFTYSKK